MRRSYRALPDNPTGAPLNPCREWVGLIVPETTTNLFTNPSWETNTTGWTFSESGSAGAYSRVSTYQYKGAYCASLTASGLIVAPFWGQIVGPTVTVGTLYTISFHVRKASKGPIPSSLVSAFVNGAAVAFDTIDYIADGWHRCVKTFQATATNAVGIRLNGAGQVIYIDAAQLEAKGYATTYCDGDQLGLLPAGLEPLPYYWTGTPHASTSVRAATTRAGGRELRVNRYGFTLLGLIGHGMAPRNNVSTELGLLDGSLYQTTIREKRAITLAGSFEASYPELLSKLRGNLKAALQHDLTGVKQPSVLTIQRYDNTQTIGARAKLVVSYTDGLEGNEQQVFSERAAIKFEQYQPGMIDSADKGTSAAGATSLGASNYIIGQTAGVWATLGTGLNGAVNCAVIGPDGKLYIGGAFTTAGGSAANRIAVWDGSAWATLSTGFDSTVNALVFDAAGNLYATGAFTTAGGGAAAKIAKWNGSAWSALGTGLGSTGRALAISPTTGNLYVAGDFTTAGGGAANRIAVWNGSAWAALGTGLDNTGSALAIDNAGNVYVGGTFLNAGGSGANRIAKWNGSAWSALGSGLGSTCAALVFDAAGNLYAGGAFTTAGGISASFAALWNGTAWQALGSGLTGGATGVTALLIVNGVLYAGGAFTTANGITLPSSLASWNGSTWSALSVSVSATVGAMAQSATTLFVGFLTSATTTRDATVTLTNPGTMPAGLSIVVSYTSATTVYTLINYTTNKAIYFNLIAMTSERVTIAYVSGTLRITSPTRGTITGAVLSTSDPDAMLLIPGSNTIGMLTSQASATVDYYYTPLFDDLDGLTGK